MEERGRRGGKKKEGVGEGGVMESMKMCLVPDGMGRRVQPILQFRKTQTCTGSCDEVEGAERIVWEHDKHKREKKGICLAMLDGAVFACCLLPLAAISCATVLT